MHTHTVVYLQFIRNEWIKEEDLHFSTYKTVDTLVSKEQEISQLNCLFDWFGMTDEIEGDYFEKYEIVPGNRRYLNNNNKDWKTMFSDRTTPLNLEHWWEDCIMVLSQISPSLAKDWLFPVSKFPKSLQSFFMKRCNNRIKNISKKKLSWYSSRPNVNDEVVQQKTARIYHQINSNYVWGKIRNCIGQKYVSNHYIPIHNLPNLLNVSFATEVVILVFATCLFGDNWETESEKYRKTMSIGEIHKSGDQDIKTHDKTVANIGDASLLYSFLHYSMNSGIRSKDDCIEMLMSDSFDRYFDHDADKLRDFITHLLNSNPNGIPSMFKKSETHH